MYHLMYFYGVTLGFWEGKQAIAARGVIETISSIFISSPLKADQTCVLVLSLLNTYCLEQTLAFSFWTC
jgi:hypothetical protein